jgi:hypothetical protein
MDGMRCGKAAWCLVLALLAAAGARPQEAGESKPPPPSESEAAATIPRALLRPQRGESVRYPSDLVIGELGRGAEPEAAFDFAWNFLAALVRRNKSAGGSAGLGETKTGRLLEALAAAEPRVFRLGGGKREPDGSVSFLTRFVGREKWIAGELYLVEERGRWRVDDLVLEEPKDIASGKDAYRLELAPYERFY